MKRGLLGVIGLMGLMGCVTPEPVKCPAHVESVEERREFAAGHPELSELDRQSLIDGTITVGQARRKVDWIQYEREHPPELQAKPRPVRIGMTQEQVMEIWGENPRVETRTETTNGVFERWVRGATAVEFVDGVAVAVTTTKAW